MSRKQSLVLIASLLLASGCPSPQATTSVDARDSSPSGKAGGISNDTLPNSVTSNVLRTDYAGSSECKTCHAEIYRSWSHSPMRRMTRDAATTTVRAPFSGEVFSFKGDRVRLFTNEGARFMRLHNRDGDSLYRITRVVGGRYREDFVGLDVTGSPDPVHSEGRGEERVMPVSFVFETESFRYKGYSVMVKERPYLKVGGIWRKQCIFCHNTVPYFSTIFDDLNPSAPSYQGSVTNDLLPESRRWSVIPTNRASLVQALQEEIHFLGENLSHTPTRLDDSLEHAIEVTRQHFGPAHFVEVGIGCESCHGGSREHAEDPRRLPSFEVRSDLLMERVGVEESRPNRAQAINRTCMRCHTVLFSRYGPTWEGGDRHENPGGSNINSGEARDFMMGACATQLSCEKCHDPHAEDKKSARKDLMGATGTQLCTSCHSHLGSPQAVAEHSHHDPNGAGGSCLACHMPLKNLGLDYGLTRYHRIGSPTDRDRVEKDRPLECALCHTESSVSDLLQSMETWWGQRYDQGRLRTLYGADLSVNTLTTTMEFGKPHEQAVAAATLGETGQRSASAGIVPLLTHRYPLVRYFAANALSKLYGEWPDVDLDADETVIRAQAKRWLETVPGKR